MSETDRAATGDRVPYFQEWIEHQQEDGYWDRMNHRGNTAHMPPVVHLGGGWHDFFLPGVLEDYAR